MLNKIIFISLLVSIGISAQNSVDKLKRDIDKILNQEFFESTQIALDVYDLTAEEQLYSKNSKLLFIPASNLKLFTTAAALNFLPDTFRFNTLFYYTGEIEGATLYGDLYVVGGMDPAFSSDDLDSLVNLIQLMGISYIAGNIYADLTIKDSLYWGNGWMWDDDPDPTSPYLSALNINDNSIEVFVEAGLNDSLARITLIPETEYVTVENNVLVHPFEPTDLEITRDWVNRKNHIIVEGIVTQGGIIDSTDHKEKLNLLNPEYYFLTLLKEKLDANGIVINGSLAVDDLLGDSKLIFSFERSIDSTLLSDINKDSDNLRSEMLLYALALSDSGAPAAIENGIEVINKLVDTMGFNRDDYSFADGSGVSRYSLISSELILALLKFMYKQKYFEMFYNSLAIAGIDGKLERRMIGTPAENNLHAKTGTLRGVCTLSGYVHAKNNHLLAFSILVQNYVEKSSVVKKNQDRICEVIANYE